MLMSLTTGFRSRRPDASWSVTSVVAIPCPSFLLVADQRWRARPRWSEVGENLLVYGNGRGFHSREEDSEERCTSLETSLRRGRTGPCCGIYCIVMRPIPQSASPADPCTEIATPRQAFWQPLRDRCARRLPAPGPHRRYSQARSDRWQ